MIVQQIFLEENNKWDEQKQEKQEVIDEPKKEQEKEADISSFREEGEVDNDYDDYDP